MDGSDNRFIIPVYQRNYDWGNAQCKQLYSDLVDIAINDRPSHFFGCIVRAHAQNGSADEYLIIDGQQRMTTVCLIFLALYWNLRRGNVVAADDKLAEKIFKKYLVDEYETKEKKIRLKLNKEDRMAFDTIVETGDSDKYLNSTVSINYRFFYGKIQELPCSVDKFFEAIRRLIVIDIFLGNNDDPQLIFESLNSTGLELTESDKIRNFVLMGLSEEQQEEYYDKYWNKVEHNCDNGLDSFVRDYLTIVTGVIPSQRKIYATFKEYVKTSVPNIEEILKDMLRYSNVYSKLTSFNLGSAKANETARRLDYLDMSVVNPYLMAFLVYAEENNLDISETEIVLGCVESFIFRRLMCDLPTNALNKIFATLHKAVVKQKGDDDTYSSVLIYQLEEKKLTSSFPKDEDFTLGFTTKNIYSMRAKNKAYIFERLENGSSKEKNDVIKNIEDGTLSYEHIMPQTLTPAWREALGDQCDTIHEKWLHTIANLTLTGYNSNYSNRPFAEKKAMEHGFSESGIRLNHFIAEFDKWTLEELELRKNKLAKMAVKIWPYPATSFVPAVKDDECIGLNEDYPFKSRYIKYFMFQGVRYDVAAWADMLLDMCKLLYSINPAVLHKEAADNSNVWIHNEQCSPTYKKVAEGIFVCTSNDTYTKLRILRNLLRKCNIEEDEVQFALHPWRNGAAKTEVVEEVPKDATFWIIPSNNSIFRVDDCIHDRGEVLWRQYNNFAVGDQIFLYGSRPDSRIKFQMEVMSVDMVLPENDVDDKEYWVSEAEFNRRFENNRYMRLRLIAETTSEALCLEELLQHGLSGAPQGAQRVKDDFLQYIQQNF